MPVNSSLDKCQAAEVRYCSITRNRLPNAGLMCSAGEESSRGSSAAVSASPWRCSECLLCFSWEVSQMHIIHHHYFGRVQNKCSVHNVSGNKVREMEAREDGRSLHNVNKLLTRKRMNLQKLFFSATTGMRRTSPSLWAGSRVLGRRSLPNMPCASLQPSVALPARPTSKPKSSHRAQLWR